MAFPPRLSLLPRPRRLALLLALASASILTPAANAVPPPETREKAPGSSRPRKDARPPAAVPTPTPSPKPSPTPAPAAITPPGSPATSSLSADEIQGYDAQPEPIRKLLDAALELTRRNLTYAYGSADPAGGGMDCSGTIYYLLRSSGFPNVPRQANEQYSWVRRSGRFQAVLSRRLESFELDNLRPGDLLFWTGTYKVDRDPPVTHTMMFLGRRKRDGKPLMIGASDGRPYDGQRRNGVSVFDFKLPAARSGDTADANTSAAPDRAPNFAGYGPVPGLATTPADPAAAASPAPSASPRAETPSAAADPGKPAREKKPVTPPARRAPPR